MNKVGKFPAILISLLILLSSNTIAGEVQILATEFRQNTDGSLIPAGSIMPITGG